MTAGGYSNLVTKIETAKDGFGNPLSITLAVAAGQTAYKVYAGTITSGTSPLVIDAFTDLGREASKGFVLNETATAVGFTVAFSIDGTTYGDALTLSQGQELDFDLFIPWKKMKITRVSSDSIYKVMII